MNWHPLYDFYLDPAQFGYQPAPNGDYDNNGDWRLTQQQNGGSNRIDPELLRISNNTQPSYQPHFPMPRYVQSYPNQDSLIPYQHLQQHPDPIAHASLALASTFAPPLNLLGQQNATRPLPQYYPVQATIDPRVAIHPNWQNPYVPRHVGVPHGRVHHAQALQPRPGAYSSPLRNTRYENQAAAPQQATQSSPPQRTRQENHANGMQQSPFTSIEMPFMQDQHAARPLFGLPPGIERSRRMLPSIRGGGQEYPSVPRSASQPEELEKLSAPSHVRALPCIHQDSRIVDRDITAGPAGHATYQPDAAFHSVLTTRQDYSLHALARRYMSKPHASAPQLNCDVSQQNLGSPTIATTTRPLIFCCDEFPNMFSASASNPAPLAKHRAFAFEQFVQWVISEPDLRPQVSGELLGIRRRPVRWAPFAFELRNHGSNRVKAYFFPQPTTFKSSFISTAEACLEFIRTDEYTFNEVFKGCVADTTWNLSCTNPICAKLNTTHREFTIKMISAVYSIGDDEAMDGQKRISLSRLRDRVGHPHCTQELLMALDMSGCDVDTATAFVREMNEK